MLQIQDMPGCIPAADVGSCEYGSDAQQHHQRRPGSLASSWHCIQPTCLPQLASCCHRIQGPHTTALPHPVRIIHLFLVDAWVCFVQAASWHSKIAWLQFVAACHTVLSITLKLLAGTEAYTLGLPVVSKQDGVCSNSVGLRRILVLHQGANPVLYQLQTLTNQ